jgi:uncharacterized protein (DUF2141 family)
VGQVHSIFKVNTVRFIFVQTNIKFMNSFLKQIILYVVVLFLSISGFSQSDSSTSIRVKVTDLRSNDGKVGLTLFNTAEGFPGNPNNAIDKKYVDVTNKTAFATFEKVPPGKYAIAVYHDEDEDGEIETNFIGIPKEGIGSSNNPKSRMGPPRYEDCEFDTRKTQELTIIMKYML